MKNNIKSLRKTRGLTQTALAEMAGITQPHVVRVERGDPGVTLKVYCEIAAALDVPLHTLFLDDLSAAEAELVQIYRLLPDERRRGWQDALALVKDQAYAQDK